MGSILLNAEAQRDETLERLAEESAQIGRGLDEVQGNVRPARASMPSAARPNEYALPATTPRR
jgi:hypothetical protein